MKDYPLVLGKPNPYAWQLIMKEHNLPLTTKAIMIGDRLDTDILFGKNSSVATCLVMTGCTTSEEQVVEIEPSKRPDYVLKSLDF